MKTLITIIASLLMSSSFAIDLSYTAQNIEDLLKESSPVEGETKRVYNVSKDEYLNYLRNNDLVCTNIADNSDINFNHIINSRSARFFMWEVERDGKVSYFLLGSYFKLKDLATCHELSPYTDSDDRKLLINNIPI